MDYTTPLEDCRRKNAAEEQTVPPVASVGADAFELVGLMFVASGDMSLERVKNAVAAVRQAVSRE